MENGKVDKLEKYMVANFQQGFTSLRSQKYFMAAVNDRWVQMVLCFNNRQFCFSTLLKHKLL